MTEFYSVTPNLLIGDIFNTLKRVELHDKPMALSAQFRIKQVDNDHQTGKNKTEM